jgi:signal transduction histidine kinase
MRNEPLFRLPGRRTSSGSFRFVFVVVYIGAISLLIYIRGLIAGSIPDIIRTNAGVGGSLLLFVGLEWLEQRWYDYDAPFIMRVVLLVIRMGLLIIIILADRSPIAMFLLPIIPFGAYFAFNGSISVLLSLFYMMAVLVANWRSNPYWYLESERTLNLIAFGFILLIVQVLTRMIEREERTRRRMEDLLYDLQSSHNKLKVYAEQAAELAAAEERNRMARDIHDSLGHHLMAITIQLEKALAYIERSPDEAVQAIRDAKQAASQALQDVRYSVGTLRHEEHHFALRNKLQDLVRVIPKENLRIDLAVTGDEARYSEQALVTLYRAAQEGLTNVYKHAQATHVTLEVRLGADEAQLIVWDNGQGFEPDRVSEPGADSERGYGLQGIRERLELVRGRLEIDSGAEQGTMLRAVVPRR